MEENNDFYKNALKLCEKDFTHEELILFLKEGSVIERQFAALNLTQVKNKTEAKILLSNLVGVDGKIREAAALKISELTQKTPEYFYNKENFKIFSDATIDIDGNVCRLAIVSAENLKNNEEFSNFYANEMIKIIQTALDEISKFTFRDKKYKINKQIFKIYWCLEALIIFHEHSEKTSFNKILKECTQLSEYTVREKCAKILKTIKKNEELNTLIITLKNDENYYVRNVLKD